MRFAFLGVVTVLYAAQSVVFLCLKQWGSALMFGAYVVANIGLMWSWS